MIQNLMEEIISLDCKPSIFKLFLEKTDHTTGFSAFVDFRSNDTNNYSLRNIVCHGDTPEEALESLLNLLKQKFSRCPHCNSYPNLDKES